MKRHVTIGADILSTVQFPFPVVPIVKSHHENWDGTGYPEGIRGADIPIGARILMVVDCFDALTSDRPYRAAMSAQEAFAILRARRGNMYDPCVVDLFINIQPSLAPAPVEATPIQAAPSAPTPVFRVVSPPEPVRTGVAERMTALLADLLPECLSVVYETDLDSGTVVARAAVGRGAKEVVGHRIPLAHGVSGWVAANNCGIDDTDAVLNLGGAFAAPELAGTSCTSVPIAVAAKALVVTVYGPRDSAQLRASAVRGIARFVEYVFDAAPRPGSPAPMRGSVGYCACLILRSPQLSGIARLLDACVIVACSDVAHGIRNATSKVARDVLRQQQVTAIRRNGLRLARSDGGKPFMTFRFARLRRGVGGVVLGLLVATPGSITPEVTAQEQIVCPAWHAKLDLAVHTALERGTDERLAVIVRGGAEARRGWRRALRDHGDAVKADLAHAGAFGGMLHVDDLEVIASDPSVRSISSDSAVAAHGAPPGQSSAPRTPTRRS